MSKKASPVRERQVLALTVPEDIGVRTRTQRILDALTEVVAEKTFAAVTITDIVGHARVSRATFYKLFSDKRACFVAAVDSFVEELRQVAASAHSSTDTPPEAIRKAGAAILELLAAKPAHAKLALIEAVAVDPTIVDRHRRPLIDALTALWPWDRAPERAGARVAFGRAQVLIADEIVAGRVERLPELLPDLVYIGLLPFVGSDEALEQARLAR